MKSQLLFAACLFAMTTTASAQFRIQIGSGHDHHGHGGIVQPHIDHHEHIIRDRHGHVTGREHHDVVHNSWSHIVPNTIRGYSTGRYYVQGNNYYYAPPAGQHVAARPAIVPFGGFTQYSDLSGRLETLVNEMLLDLHYNYSHNPGFAETYREGYELLGVAKFIHAAEHNNDREAMRSKLLGTDRLFHHIQDDVRGWTRIHHRQIGTLGLISKMEIAESTLHHLMNDVGVSESGQAPQPTSAAGGGVEQAPPPPGIQQGYSPMQGAQQGYVPQQGVPQGFAPQRAPAQNYAPQRSEPSAAPLGNSPPPPTVE